MTRYFKNQEQVNLSKDLSISRNLPNKYGKQLLDTATKTAVDALKIASKKLIYKLAEVKGEFIGNKIADEIAKTKPVSDEISKDVEKIIIPPKKRREILNK